MPAQLPAGFGNAEYTHSEGGNFVEVTPGIYPCSIFEAEEKTSEKGKPGLKVTFRINGGQFDGVDVVEQFAGLTADTIFRTHDILKGAGILDTYFQRDPQDEKKGRWVAVPVPSDLIGKQLQVRIEAAPTQSRDKDSKKPQFEDNGTPKMMNFNRPTGFYPMGENVQFKPTSIKPRIYAASPAEVGGAQGGGFGGGQPWNPAQQGQGQPQQGGSPWGGQQVPQTPQGGQQAGPGQSGW